MSGVDANQAGQTSVDSHSQGERPGEVRPKTPSPTDIQERETIVSEVLITPEALQGLLGSAYEAGCQAVHDNYEPDPDPSFSEAAWDYVASLDFTETTRPYRSNPQPGSEGWKTDAADFLRGMADEYRGDASIFVGGMRARKLADAEDCDRWAELLAASPTPPTAQPGEVERLREARDAALALAASVVRSVAAEKRNQGEKQSALNYAARRIEDLRARAALTPKGGEEG